jgi:hypothetical protein
VLKGHYSFVTVKKGATGDQSVCYCIFVGIECCMPDVWCFYRVRDDAVLFESLSERDFAGIVKVTGGQNPSRLQYLVTVVFL